jgi:hypothetical protein
VKVTAATIAALVVMCPSVAAAVATQHDDPDLEVRTTAPSGRAVVAVPDTLAGARLASDAFVVTADGKPVTTVASSRVADRDLDMTIVVDLDVDESQLRSVEGVLIEMVLRLPGAARAEIVQGSTTTGLSADRQTTLDAVAALTTTSGPPPDLDAVTLDPAAGRHHAVVVVTNRPDVAIHPPAPDSETFVYGLSLVSAPDASGRLGAAATASGGRVVTAADTSGLLVAADAVTDDIYRLYVLAAPREAVEGAGWILSVKGIDGTHDVAMAARSPAIGKAVGRASAQRSPIPGAGSGTPVALFVAAVAVFLALAALVVVETRSRRRRPGWRPTRQLEPLGSQAATTLDSSSVMQSELRALDAIDVLARWRSHAPVRVAPDLYAALATAEVAPGCDLVESVSVTLLAGALDGEDAPEPPSRWLDAADGLSAVAQRAAFAAGGGRKPDLDLLAQWAWHADHLDAVIPLGVTFDDAGPKPVTTLGLLDAVTSAAQLMLAAEHRVAEIRDGYLASLDQAAGTRSAQVVDAIVNHPLMSLADVQSQTGTSHQGARNQLNRMTGRGWLTVVGRFGRGGRKYWIASEVVGAVVEIVGNRTPDRTEEVSWDAST